jgi:hypothetical protein
MEERKRTPPRIPLKSMIAIAVTLVLVFSAALYHVLTYEKPFVSLSPDIIVKIDMFLHSNPEYRGLQIMSMDLSKNARHIVFSHLETNELQVMYTNYLTGRVSQIMPIFTNNGEENNIRMIKIINHEFVCTPYSESALYKNMPLGANYISTICATSIPPSYGNFVGSIHLFLAKPPTDIEKSIIRMHIKELSEKVFSEMR